MTALVPGGNAPVTATRLLLEAAYDASTAVPEVDVAAFLLKEDGRVTGDADMVFYGQPASAGRAVTLDRAGVAPGGGREAVYAIDVESLPAWCERIAFTGTIHDGKTRGVSFSDVPALRLLLRDGPTGAAILTFDVPVAGKKETALILGELYRRNGQWKFRAVGQGYEGGLGPLAESYGVDVGSPAATVPPVPEPAPPPPPPAPAPAPVQVVPPIPPRPPEPPAQPAAPEPPRAPISLSKISLTKDRPSISLEKRPDYGDVTVNLNWSRPEAGGGLLSFRKPKAIDLDLGCLFELNDGHKGCIQALGDSFGSYRSEPFVSLDGDDRSGDSTDGEWLRVNGRYFANVRRLLIFAFIYDGAPNWAQTDGVVTVRIPGETPVEVRMDDGSNASRMCAVALVENVAGKMQISREVRYFRGHDFMDRHYGWGLRWGAGSKG